MVQIKVTPEMLEEVANRASNTRIALESIHNNLCNEIDHLCFQWIGASNQQFIQMFNEARPKAFTSINSIIQVEEDLKRIAEKFRNTDNQDVTMEEGAMCGKPSSEENGFDGKKLARDIAGEISGEYDVRRVWDGIDPSTGEKLSGWERAGAGVMAVAGLTPFGKIAKVGKGVKMTAKATEAANTAKKVTAGTNSGANLRVIEELKGPVIDGKRVGSGKKVDNVKPVWGRDEEGKPFIEKEFPHVSKEHGFSDVIDNYSRFAEEFPLVGGDRIKRELYQITGSNNGNKGVFEWIVEPNGDVSHRRFIENGVMTGKPNQIPKK
ncbi:MULTISPECIES: WXG100 family type VII secretion target [Bacillus]|uniref:WXG100 family type VII secretion target n=1 Tax=Bacillus TaxID=1386 RepID=UPI0019125CC6|nr:MULTISPECIES: WXG100 family type VII secretion target [Bacillus]MBK5471323.1 WXG100 family type VII secretion target [Bacillus sp. TH19]WOA56038.1 WXG100 family type VII secretion target [Bacillus mycoides]